MDQKYILTNFSYKHGGDGGASSGSSIDMRGKV
jgi:hypothetical protein